MALNKDFSNYLNKIGNSLRASPLLIYSALFPLLVWILSYRGYNELHSLDQKGLREIIIHEIKNSKENAIDYLYTLATGGELSFIKLFGLYSLNVKANFSSSMNSNSARFGLRRYYKGISIFQSQPLVFTDQDSIYYLDQNEVKRFDSVTSDFDLINSTGNYPAFLSPSQKKVYGMTLSQNFASYSVSDEIESLDDLPYPGFVDFRSRGILFESYSEVARSFKFIPFSSRIIKFAQDKLALAKYIIIDRELYFIASAEKTKKLNLYLSQRATEKGSVKISLEERANLDPLPEDFFEAQNDDYKENRNSFLLYQRKNLRKTQQIPIWYVPKEPIHVGKNPKSIVTKKVLLNSKKIDNINVFKKDNENYLIVGLAKDNNKELFIAIITPQSPPIAFKSISFKSEDLNNESNNLAVSIIEDKIILAESHNSKFNLFELANGQKKPLAINLDKLSDISLVPYSSRSLYIIGSVSNIATVLLTFDPPNFNQQTLSFINLHLPENPFTTTISINRFFLAVALAFLICLYILGFSIIREFNFQKIIVDAPVFAKLPTLKQKIDQLNHILIKLRIRYDVMLYLGIAIGIFGVGFFLIFLEDYKANFLAKDSTEILELVRPITLLIFLETLSFFFLRQYRIIFREYKVFYSVYLKLFNYFHFLELSPTLNDEDIKQLKSQLLSESYNLNSENKDEIGEPAFQELIKKIIDKIPIKTA